MDNQPLFLGKQSTGNDGDFNQSLTHLHSHQDKDHIWILHLHPGIAPLGNRGCPDTGWACILAWYHLQCNQVDNYHSGSHEQCPGIGRLGNRVRRHRRGHEVCSHHVYHHLEGAQHGYRKCMDACMAKSDPLPIVEKLLDQISMRLKLCVNSIKKEGRE